MRSLDLRSDTVTLPTQTMREAMAQAAVGDDVYGDDPTVNALEKTAAAILGKEAALFVSSGTMGNQLGIMTQTQRGDEVIVGRDSHIFVHEVGAAAVLAGVTLNTIPFAQGMIDADLIEAAIRSQDIHEPPTRLVCIENALANGRLVPEATMRAVYAMAHRRGLAVHLDGARIFNAAVALGLPVQALTRHCDTLSCCLSKGLCAPVGSIFAGSAAVVARARKYRKMLGGGMRQCGILAAAGLIALQDMPARLAQDHANARLLAEQLQRLPEISLDRESVQINMVFCRIAKPTAWQQALPALLLAQGIKINAPEGGEFRFVTNNDISADDIMTFVGALKTALQAA
jgi:threonine aldolase